MPLFLHRRNDDVRPVTFTVAFQANFDKAIIAAYLTKLGLVSNALVEAFNAQYTGFTANNQLYKSFTESCLFDLHTDGVWLSQALATAKKNGYATITFQVPVYLLNQIAAFLASPLAKEISDRLKDAGREEREGFKDSLRGVAMNVSEGAVNIGQGIKNTASGMWDGLTSSTGEERFKQGWIQVAKGIHEGGKGIFKIGAQTPADYILMNGGKMASAFQTILFLESVGRPLDQAEKQVLQQIFGSSIEYDAVRIKIGYAGLLNIGDDGGFKLLNNQRPITFGNTIYMKNTPYNISPASQWLSTLVHEMTHIWQHQNGGTDYMLEALMAQTVGEGYEYERYIVANPPRTWFLLNPEQQAHLIEDAYVAGYFHNRQWVHPKMGVRVDIAKYLTNQNIWGQLQNGQGAT